MLRVVMRYVQFIFPDSRNGGSLRYRARRPGPPEWCDTRWPERSVASKPAVLDWRTAQRRLATWQARLTAKDPTLCSRCSQRHLLRVEKLGTDLRSLARGVFSSSQFEKPGRNIVSFWIRGRMAETKSLPSLLAVSSSSFDDAMLRNHDQRIRIRIR